MRNVIAKALQPRKTPVQARSLVTVDVVCEATIQLLLSEGMRKLTTTRVAEKAGVSVGTLYQYYPNKQAVLYAVLQRHLNQVADAMEAACAGQRGRPLREMVDVVVRGFVQAKTARIDESRALYLVAADLNAAVLVADAGKRMRTALANMLSTAADARFADLPMVSFMFLAAMVGPTRAMLEDAAPERMLDALPSQLNMLCLNYLQCVNRLCSS